MADFHDPSASWGEAQLRALLNAAPDALVIVDATGHIAFVNVQAERLFGFSRAEIVGSTIERLVPDRSRHQHARSRDTYQAEPTARPMGAGLKLVALRKDGTELPVDVSLSPVDTPHGLLVLAAIRDVSHAEQRIQLALRAAHMGVWEFEFATGRVAWSPTMALVFGLPPEQAPRTTKELMALIHPDDRAAVDASIAKAIEGEEYEIEFRTTPHEGEVIWVAGHARLLRDAIGRPERLIGVGMDITARKALEVTLAAETAERILAQSAIAEQRLRVLKATMRSVHDIVNNALNGIAAFRSEAESALSEESLALLDDMVADTSERLRLLSALESTPEMKMDIGVGIDYLGPSRR
jgi:PAS domain S-box-containing protein